MESEQYSWDYYEDKRLSTSSKFQKREGMLRIDKEKLQNRAGHMFNLGNPCFQLTCYGVIQRDYRLTDLQQGSIIHGTET